MRNDLLCAILDCGTNGLDMLDDTKADMFEVISQMRSEGLELTLNNIMAEIFSEGIQRLDEAVKSLRADLEDEDQSREMTDASREQLEKLKRLNINPEHDFGFYVNCSDTSLYFNPQPDKEEKRQLYEELFQQELLDLMDYTGFNILW